MPTLSRADPDTIPLVDDAILTGLRTEERTKPEPEVEPFTLPEGVEPAPRDVLIDHPEFEIPRPSRLAVSGFLIIWGLVLALAGTFFLILR